MALLITSENRLPVPVLDTWQMDDMQFFEFCQLNRDLRIERDRHGTVYITPPEELQEISTLG